MLKIQTFLILVFVLCFSVPAALSADAMKAKAKIDAGIYSRNTFKREALEIDPDDMKKAVETTRVFPLTVSADELRSNDISVLRGSILTVSFFCP